MYTVDIHSNKETVEVALYNLDQAIKYSRKEPDKLLCVIVGYGASGGTHKIKTAVLEKLKEYEINKYIKGFILGSNLDLFNNEYLKFKFRDKIPDSEKKKCNPGCIYVVV